jgi:hypothetical protein
VMVGMCLIPLALIAVGIGFAGLLAFGDATNASGATLQTMFERPGVRIFHFAEGAARYVASSYRVVTSKRPPNGMGKEFRWACNKNTAHACTVKPTSFPSHRVRYVVMLESPGSPGLHCPPCASDYTLTLSGGAIIGSVLSSGGAWPGTVQGCVKNLNTSSHAMGRDIRFVTNSNGCLFHGAGGKTTVGGAETWRVDCPVPCEAAWMVTTEETGQADDPVFQVLYVTVLMSPTSVSLSGGHTPFWLTKLSTLSCTSCRGPFKRCLMTACFPGRLRACPPIPSRTFVALMISVSSVCPVTSLE